MPGEMSAARPGLWGVLRRSIGILKREGIASLFFRILAELGYRRVLVIENAFSQPDRSFDPGPDVTTGLLDESTAEEYAAFLPLASAAEIRGLLRQGHTCFVTRYRGAIASVSWAASKTARILYLDCDIEVGPDEAYIYGRVTAPGLRKRGLAEVGSVETVSHFRTLGYRRLIAVVVPENKPAIIHAEKAGFRRVGVMGTVKLGPWRHYFLKMQGGARPIVLKRRSEKRQV